MPAACPGLYEGLPRYHCSLHKLKFTGLQGVMTFQIYHPGVYSREGTQVRQEQQTSQQSQGRHPAGMQEKEVFLRRIKGCAKGNNSPKQGMHPEWLIFRNSHCF